MALDASVLHHPRPPSPREAALLHQHDWRVLIRHATRFLWPVVDTIALPPRGQAAGAIAAAAENGTCVQRFVSMAKDRLAADGDGTGMTSPDVVKAVLAEMLLDDFVPLRHTPVADLLKAPHDIAPLLDSMGACAAANPLLASFACSQLDSGVQDVIVLRASEGGVVKQLTFVACARAARPPLSAFSPRRPCLR